MELPNIQFNKNCGTVQNNYWKYFGRSKTHNDTQKENDLLCKKVQMIPVIIYMYMYLLHVLVLFCFFQIGKNFRH